MLLSSVIFALQETLEAALLISVLLAISSQQSKKATWLAYGFIAGSIFAYLYASNMARISEWFDYVGQEVVNAILQIAIALLIVLCVRILSRGLQGQGAVEKASANRTDAFYACCAAGTVAFAITREGSEVLLYLIGVLQQSEYFQPVLAGSFIGFGIGISMGILLFYGLISLPEKTRTRAPILLLALYSGNMLSQAVLQFTQADWISSGQAVWDTTGLLSETTIAGQLLYALVGYEATPSGMQVIAYFSGTALVLIAWVFGSQKRPAILLLSVLLYLPGLILADGFVIDKIYHPYVQATEQEIEWRAITQDEQLGVANSTSLYKLAYGRSFSDQWAGELYVVGQQSDDQSFEIEAYEIEAKRQLTEQGEFWADWGLVFELENEVHKDIWELATGVLAEKEWGKWSGTANLFVISEWGSDIKNEIEAKLGLQLRYRYSKAFEPALEFYSGQNTIGLGPAFLGQFNLQGKRKLKWEAGIILGLDSKSPNQTWRFLAEFEF
ncbi:MAG: FTR1 family protein [Lysobacterales bacterium]|jgi:FTR1 family protein